MRGVVGSWATAFLVLFAALFAVALWWPSALEDPFISFRYAQHLAQGGGLTWNPGEPPIEGYTNLLWVLLMALPARLGLDMMLAGKILGALLFLLLLLALYREGLRLGLGAARAGLAVGTLVLTPVWAYYAASGLETLLFTLLTGLALIAHQREMEQQHRWPGSALLALLATLTRPEGLGVWGLLFIMRLREMRRGQPGWLGLWLPTYLLPLTAYLLWKQHYFGGIVPLPFYAKHSGDSLFQVYSGLRYIARFVMGYAGPVLLLTLLVRQFRSAKARAVERDGFPGLLLFVALYPVYLVIVGGDVEAAFPSFRLLVPLGPPLVLLLMHALRNFEFPGLALRGLLLLGLICAAIGMAQVQELYLFTKRSNDYNGLSVRALRVPGEPPAAAFLREDARRRGLERPTIAVLAAGQIPFYTGFTAIDRLGLNDPRVAHLPKRQRGADTKFDTELLLACRPHYIQTNIPKTEVLAGCVQRPWRLADRELWASEEFQRDFTLLEEMMDPRAFFLRKDLAQLGQSDSTRSAHER